MLKYVIISGADLNCLVFAPKKRQLYGAPEDVSSRYRSFPFTRILGDPILKSFVFPNRWKRGQRKNNQRTFTSLRSFLRENRCGSLVRCKKEGDHFQSRKCSKAQYRNVQNRRDFPSLVSSRVRLIKSQSETRKELEMSDARGIFSQFGKRGIFHSPSIFANVRLEISGQGKRGDWADALFRIEL